MRGTLIFHLLFQAVLLFNAFGWQVRIPKDIHGLQGSCLVIPCSFSYSLYPPQNPHRVVWYQWVSKGYPVVYDPLHPNEVIKKFRGKTDLYGNSTWDCSLLIKNLEPSHHGEKLYAWIDPENVGSSTYAFYEHTSTIQVDAHPQLPTINIYGGERTGDAITVVCSAFHTCPYSKPDIIVSGIEGSDEIDSEHIEDGLWKVTLTRKGVLQTESSAIECSVTHYGGITVVAMKVKTAQLRSEVKTVWVYVLAPSLVFLLSCITAGFVIYKKQQRQPTNDIQDYQTQSRQRRSRWNRFSRQFSRSEGRAAWNNTENRSDTRANVCTVSGNKPFNKPRMPSPKSEPKSFSGYDDEAEYTNMDDLQMYGNV